MKTRSNMPLYVLEVSNVKTLSNSQIDLLRCGDYLVKKDASGEHAYKVTFKSDTGMCITYHDAYCVETQSYDKIDGVWTYNSEDKTIIAEPSFENIVDKDSHKRFIEGSLVLETLSGVSFAYGKWSLSGSHLILVLFGTASANMTVSGKVATAEIPLWVAEKIVPLYSTLVDNKQVALFSDDDTTGTAIARLNKVNNKLEISFQSFTPAKERIFRIVYDLLIDNE